MLLTKNVKAKWTRRNNKHFESKGYLFTKFGDEFEIKVEDLTKGSQIEVNVECDECGELKHMTWYIYLKCVKEDSKYYCQKCSMKLYGGENSRLTKLKNGKSFEKWCLDNTRQDVLDRWDYELNKLNPNEINYGTKRKYYFKCPKGIHKSELKNIGHFTKGQEGSIKCKQCNSFAQWGIDNICNDFLDKYWDYEKNIIDPWLIDYSSDIKVYIKCQEKDYHKSYPISCSNFIIGRRCSYCSSKSGKVHILESLGTMYPESTNKWSSKNKKSPYEYSPHSGQEVYWKCPDGIHNDFERNIYSSNYFNFRCPECSYSKGEKAISEYLIKRNIFYIPQKEFEDLTGMGGGLLSYDHYLLKYNLLVEFQGEQHERFIKGWHITIEGFKKQLEHDRRKKEYAQNNKYNFLEIWYYDFDRIEEILNNAINKLNLRNI